MLRRERERAALLAALDGCDRLVLLGDVLELRHGPVRDALSAAAPVLRELGAAVGAEVVVIVPGNHDHALLRGWLERARGSDAARLSSRRSTGIAREPLGPSSRRLGPARVRVAYPGAWLREDVYAIHGHYGDRHNTVPIVERLGAGVTVRLAGEPAGGPSPGRGLRGGSGADVRVDRHGGAERRPAGRGR